MTADLKSSRSDNDLERRALYLRGSRRLAAAVNTSKPGRVSLVCFSSSVIVGWLSVRLRDGMRPLVPRLVMRPAAPWSANEAVRPLIMSSLVTQSLR